jgi:hypothetical protein
MTAASSSEEVETLIMYSIFARLIAVSHNVHIDYLILFSLQIYKPMGDIYQFSVVCCAGV